MTTEPIPLPAAPKSGRFKTIVAWVCAPIVLVELFVLAIVMWRAALDGSNQKASGQTYFSTARLIVNSEQVNPTLNGEEDRLNFYGTLIELICSATVKEGALARLRALHPELDPPSFTIQAGQEEAHTAAITVRSITANPVFAQEILDATMSEFLANQTKHSGKAVAEGLHTELRGLEKEMARAEKKIETAGQGGASADQLTEAKAALLRLKDAHERHEDMLRNWETYRSEASQVLILEHASPGKVFPLPSIYDRVIKQFEKLFR